jgi:mutual gliding-motility protein MglA
MALFNYATKEITIKIVFYGPGLSGKTTNLQYLHSVFEPNRRGKLLSLATEADRTLFFDFLPVELGKISDFSIRFQLYTVPGQVRYNATRKLVLKGADAIVFVADSQREMREQNKESIKNMRENLIANNIDPDDITVILQYNKRDLTNILSIDELNNDLNENSQYEYKESVAINGKGVEDTFQQITKLVIKNIAKKHKIQIQTSKKPDESIEGKSSKDTGTAKSLPEEHLPPPSIIEATRYESIEREQNLYKMSEDQEKPVHAFPEEPTIPQAVIKEIREVPVIPPEQLNIIIKDVADISQTLKDLRIVISNIYSEIKDAKKEKKETVTILKNLTNILDNIKEKKSWFRFY